jgi:tetratricopeptide (TPR) repeat protein
VYALSGRTDDAVKILRDLDATSKRGYVPPVAYAIVYAGLNKLDDAFRWLEKAVDERDGLLIYLKVGSAFDPLRSDRRFSEILTRVGLQGDPGLVVSHPVPSPKPEPPVLRPRPAPLWAKMLLGVAAVVAAYFGATRLPIWWSPSRVILAVQPFKTFGSDQDVGRLAEIAREEIFTRLSELHTIKLGVVEQTTADAELSLETICSRRGLTYILTGVVRRDGEQMVITDQLVLCKDLTGVMGDRHVMDTKGSGTGLLVDDTVRKVLTAMFGDVQPEHQVNPKAYEAYLQGRFDWNLRTTQSLMQAIDSFQKAIAYDASYAPSYAGLADCYALLGTAPYTALMPSEAFPKAKANARKALELDPNLAEAHVSLGFSALAYDWNYAEAEREFSKAKELRPGYATAHQYYAYYLTAMGDVNQAIAERKIAVSIEPKSPLLNTALGEAYYQARQFKDSVVLNQKALAIDPHYADAIINVGRAYEQMGMYPEALHAYQSILAFAPHDPALLALLGHLDAVSGQPAAARGIIAQLQQMSAGKDRYVPSLYIALIYIGLGDHDQAFAWLDKAYAERSEYLVYLPTDPMADPLRNDPRFPALLERLGFKK